MKSRFLNYLHKEFTNNPLLSWSLVILIILFSISISIFTLSRNNSTQNFFLNFSTEILGIFLTYFLIDNAIKYREKQEKVKIIRNAFIQLKGHTNRFLGILVVMYKASCLNKPTDLKNTFKEILLTEDFYESIKNLNFNSDAPIYQNMIWAKYISIETKNFMDSYEKVLDKYSYFLDSRLICEIEGIKNSSALYILSTIYAMYDASVKTSGNTNFVLPSLKSESILDLVRDFLIKLFDFIEYFRDSINEKDDLFYNRGIWGDNVSPKISSSRIKY